MPQNHPKTSTKSIILWYDPLYLGPIDLVECFSDQSEIGVE